MPILSSYANEHPLTLLHTSDWHLGRRLYGQIRYREFEEFLVWLEQAINQYQVDILIVAGDVFDTMTPSNRAQSLYYEFLGRVTQSKCQHIVIVAGNHDSPTFLDAPSNILKSLNVHVVGTACENLADEVLTLNDSDGNPSCIITAVPYLRDRDVRSSHAGESDSDKDSRVIEGIRAHYDGVADIAKARQLTLSEMVKRHIPIIATGHLFASGGRTTNDDGVRNLYVGSLGKISADMFADCFDYVALGHLHVPQRVGGCEHIRYCGSPIAMGFGEAHQQKQVLLVQFGESVSNTMTDKPILSSTSDSTASPTLVYHDQDKHMQVISVPIPTFQRLVQINGDMAHIEQSINALPKDDSIWLEVIYDGDEIVSHLNEDIQALLKDTAFKALKVRNTNNYNKVLTSSSSTETLQDLDVIEVFERCMSLHDIADSQKDELREAYQQILHDATHKDVNSGEV